MFNVWQVKYYYLFIIMFLRFNIKTHTINLEHFWLHTNIWTILDLQ